jgi:hypothetical protein
MPLPTRRVFNTLTDEQGQPQAGVRVRAQLLLPKSTRRYQSEVLPIEAETVTDANGYWFLDLVPTDILDDAGAFYWIVEGDHMHKIKLPSGADPVWIYDVIVPGDMDAHIVRELLPMVVTSIRIPDRAPLKGDIELRPGTEITLEEDYAERAITIHGRRIVGEQGIIVTPRLPYDRVVTPDYGTEIQPIAASSSAGMLNRFARVDHTHEGVHALDAMTGDITIEPIQGLQKVDDAVNKKIVVMPNYGTEIRPIAAASAAGTLDKFARVDHTHEGVHTLDAMTGDITIEAMRGLWKVDDTINRKIILKNPYAMFLTPDDFRPYGAINKDFFPWLTNENVAFTAQDSQGNDVTAILTDNDTTTFVTVAPLVTWGFPDSIFLQWVTRSIHKVRFYVSTVRKEGVISVTVKDYANNTLVSGEVFVSGVGWYEVLLRTPPHAVKATIVATTLTDPIRGETLFAAVDIAEVRLDGGIAIPALYTGVRWATGTDYSEGIIQSICFLYEGWQYRYRAWFGSTGDAAAAIVEGRLYDETGLVTVFRPKGGLGMGTQDQLFVLSGDLITPTQSKFFLIEWFLASDGESGMGGAPHFLGMLIE